MTADTNITFLRPSVSVIFPQKSAPKIAPHNPEAVIISIILLSIPKSFWKKGMAPDITPVSNPNNSPPVAATTAMT